MKQPGPSRCALALCIMVAVWPLRAESQASSGDGSRYRHFMVYPHRQAGYAALRVGDERTAIAEFTRARELAPQSVDTALDLAEAYRHFGLAAQAQAVLDEQMRYTPNDAHLRAAMTPPAPPAVDCSRDNLPVCRAKRGFGDLQAGDLARAQAELDAPDFAASPQGRDLRHALAQRAIYLGDDQRAIAQLSELDAHDKLSQQERDQWFALLLKHGEFDMAEQLQSREGWSTPTQQLALAQAMDGSGQRKALASYMAMHQPAFANVKDERQWINLLAQAARTQPALLDHYRVRFPANAAWLARVALPMAMTRGDRATAANMLSRLPPDSFREERFNLDLQQGRYADAQQQASALIAQADGYRLLDPLSYRLMAAGATNEAKQLLLDAYPFAGHAHAAALLARLAVLAGEQPALFTVDDRARLSRPLDSVTLRIAQLQILSALRDCEGIHHVMADLSPDYPAELWRQLGDCYGEAHPGLAEYAYAQAGKRKPSTDTTRALAYQAYSAQDYKTALLAWRSVPAAHMQQADLIAAATTALTIHETAVASAWLDTYAAQGGKQDGNYWWLRAQADEPRDPVLATTDLENAVDVQPDPRYYARLATLETQAGDSQRALLSWQHASALAPDDSRMATSLGYAYLQAGQPQNALTQFERAHQADPDNAAVTRQLLYVNQQLGDNTQARHYAEQAIDQFDAVDPGGTSVDSKQDQDDLYSLRRLHENLGRTWSFNADMSLGDTVSSAANSVAPGVSYRSYAQLEAQYHLDPQLTGGDLNTLTAYARLFAGSGASGAVWPVHGAMLGIGVHWKPLISQNILLSIEQQTPADNSRDTRNDTLLRASGSWSFGPKLGDDWHASGWGWPTQNFYVDVAHYLRAKESVITLDYRFGLHDKIANGQTIEPYVHVQYTGISRTQGLTYLRDGRAGLGVQWNVWYGQTHYDAYPHRFSVAVEGQHAFTTYLRDKNAVFLIMRTQW
ncbi:NfrA family protein [Dyella sp.]|uniref:NfrA family protein n=1 Tax=Dyella sp. TaxID=1869338 RepID=UPI002B479210|nr:tetratricopeptide repeat protein [Dyella sp.]HKT28458.1 tetratricopeptide repeat protein [Dyella sp.]